MNFIETHNLTGVVIGICTFLIIGLFHPLVIKGEYHFGVRVWWAFLVAGLATLAGALLVENIIASALLGVTGFSSLWGIGEVFHQKKRVEKGWFPRNPKRS
jgi:branched-subunit amino acid transport protein